MAILTNGPNGGFSGKVGSVVGYKWKNKDVIRGLPRKSHKPRSEARLANEQAMKLIMKSLKPLKIIVRRTFRQAAESLNMSAFNLALSINKKLAIVGEYPELTIDWSQFTISKGPLPGLTQVTTAWVGDGLKVTWNDNSSEPDAGRDDQVTFTLYSYKFDHWFFFPNEATRSTTQCTLSVEDDWVGTEVELFGFFMTFGGETVSDSHHCHVTALVNEL
ncbi:hypothetical protein GCM10011386_22840 [Parapedobacter defluvii]|uniref:Uncharacterized protein n=1 Tax=Parapedobacter defluvii TaxID=2045106 RepID=A0ABQ1LXH4_9SPHI|nr:DUF6266 family protein [Parapedobacter defluvii]GGC30266.1 hypothetical protein GCM10011386_22840 [Parapedobacter defluvii]